MSLENGKRNGAARIGAGRNSTGAQRMPRRNVRRETPRWFLMEVVILKRPHSDASTFAC
jgi:hypothetical protein